MVNQNKVILKTIQIFEFLGLCNSSYCKMNCNNWFTNEMQLELHNTIEPGFKRLGFKGDPDLRD
jgi:hypothetical protein